MRAVNDTAPDDEPVTAPLRQLLLIACALFASHDACAQAAHSLDDVRATAVKAAQAQLPATRGKYFLSAGALDSRLRLAPCATPLIAAARPGNSNDRITVGVQCVGGNQWTVYVPVAVQVELPVLVLQRGLARDARVDTADVELQTKRVSGSAANFVGDMSQLQGRHLKRALVTGTPLTLDVLVTDVLVKRGQQVTLLARTGSIEIRAQGKALSDGGVSDRIRVQNVTSMKIVEGIVSESGAVLVAL